MLYLPTARLWRVALDGTMRMITMGDVSYWNPDIGQSGSVVAASVRLKSDIWSFPTDGSPRDNVRKAIRIINQNSHVATPTAGPGDREVAFVSDRGGHSNILADGFSMNIWTLSTAKGEWRQITDFGGRPTFIVRRVSWSSDGRSVLAAVSEGDADIVLLDGVLSTGRD